MRVWIALVVASLGCAAPRPTTRSFTPAPPADASPAEIRDAPLAAAAAPRPKMRVHFIDVGQGAATLFEFPHGAVLVDTGGEKNGSFDSEAELDAYLAEFFARRNDLGNQLTSLVLTHPHVDHTRGVPLVIEHYAPRNVVTNGQTYGSGSAQQRLAHAYAAQHEDTVGFEAVRLETIPAGGLRDAVIDPIGPSTPGDVDPDVTVLWGRLATDPGWGSEWGKPRFANNNNHSVVLRVDFGEASVLVTGDLEDVAIEDLLARYRETSLLDADVYQVGHHGSANGTTADLLQAVTPDCAVLGVGSPERESPWTAWDYGHPREEIVALLEVSVGDLRPSIDVRVGRKKQTFEDRTVAKAIYATGWDGTVVLEAGTDGVFSVVEPAPARALVNVNTATADELEPLPKIGATRARAIVTDRTAHGIFATIDSLIRVPGVGPATLEAIRPLITVGANP